VSSAATWAWVGVVVAVLNALAVAVALVVAATTGQDLALTDNSAWINVVAGPTFPLLGALVLRSRGHEEERPGRLDRLAWLLVGFGTLCAATVAGQVFGQDLLDRRVPGALGIAWVANWLWTAVAPTLLLALLWFPDGEAPGPRWRWVERALVVAYSGMLTGVALEPGPLVDFPDHRNPLGWEAAAGIVAATSTVGFATLAGCFLAVVASLVVRFVRGDAGTRAQLRWLLAVLAVVLVSMAMPDDVLPAVSVALGVVAPFLLPVALAVALTRRDGYGLPRVLVFGVLSVGLLGGYLAVVALAHAWLGDRADPFAAVTAAGAVAVLAAPFRNRLQRSVERLVYGDRGDPHRAISELGRRIAGSPDDLLDEVVRTVAGALRAPYAAVVLAGDPHPTAAAGSPRTPQVAVPLSLQGTEIGSLLVAQRSPVEPYDVRDLALLDDLARHIAVAAHAAVLSRDLQRSRESIVLAREEERRRIRRDLHDGLGPALAGVAFGLDAARNTLSRDPGAVDASLAALKGEVQSSIADVRRLVYDLRPPELDQLGLVPAVEEYAARLEERGAVAVKVESSVLPVLPAAVEVAAYRIATEALTNVARHARARSATVSFAADSGSLRVAVADDGVGFNGNRGRGVGLEAMAERAAELGGSCDVAKRPEGGTDVVALIPLREA